MQQTSPRSIDPASFIAYLGAAGIDGFFTTADDFMSRIWAFYPGLPVAEFTGACKRLVALRALHLRKFGINSAVIDDYKDARDDATFFLTDTKMKLNLRTSAASHIYFKQLSDLIEPPAGFKPPMGFDRFARKQRSTRSPR